MMNKRFRLAGLALATLAAFPLWTCAQEAKYPSRPVRLLVGSLAGGSTDVVARKLATRLAPLLGQSIVVENKAGAGGLIAGLEVARAAPDGYTLQMGSTSTNTLAPLMAAKPQFAYTDFSTVAIVGAVPLALFVSSSVKAASAGELIAHIRQSPGKYSYASAGVGTTSNMTGELMRSRNGLDFLHVPYKGGPAMDQAVAADEVQFSFDSPGSVMQLHRAGKVRILALLTETRSELAPDIPTALESGVNLVSQVSFFVLAPARTPKVIVDSLNQAITRIVRSEEFRSELLAIAVQPAAPANATGAHEFVKAEVERWKDVVKAVVPNPAN